MNDVTIIIPTFNEELRIEDTVKSALTVTPNVIVIDDNSNDATQSIVTKLGANLVVKPSDIPNGKSASINYVATQVTTEFTIIIDADCVIVSSDDLLHELQDGADLVGNKVGIKSDDRLISELESSEYDFIIGTVRPFLHRLGYINTVSGAYLGIRTELLKAHPVPSNVNGEDMYLTQIGRQLNWDIRLSNSYAYTYPITGIKALLVQRARWITGSISVIRATGNKLPIVELIPYFYNLAALTGGLLGGLATGNGLLGLCFVLVFWFLVNVVITRNLVNAVAYLGYAQLNLLAFVLAPYYGRTWVVNR
jgi:cellulose synthase/poly-beta-1,6-N-acetylglucosamine synthase-like glycosyltransferase